ncbi:MAG: tRNA pseudouridine(55) synthase TruB [Candidatus Ancillula sp.]|jgi:tRNA pseudouridine55 synthase|nr:tRNA pseudouridine(55) synthase TruB [Candidatus Ancillula sp.]
MMIQVDDTGTNNEIYRGVFLVDKPAGITSASVDYKLREHVAKLTGIETKKQYPRVGHAGTLDPFATGALVIGIGDATKELNELKGSNKQYEATIRLGFSTDTDDYTGTIIETATSKRLKALTDDEIEDALYAVLERETQIPCAYSAKHVDGVRAYDLARNARENALGDASAKLPELKPIAVKFELNDFSIVRDSSNIFIKIDVLSSEGAYIRAIARDLGDELEVGGHLTELRRIGVGEYSIDQFVKLEDLLKTTTYDEFAKYSRAFLSKFVATIGAFDGVHIGHQELIQRTVKIANEIGNKSVVFIVNRAQSQKLMDITTRKALIKSLGVDECAVLNVEDIKDYYYQEFLDIVNEKYNITTWALTEESTIGKDATGDIVNIQDYLEPKGIDVVNINMLMTYSHSLGQVALSSTLIRNALETGHVKIAQKLLGRLYKIKGTVAEGNKRGRKLGFPTANLECIDTVLPREGVYYGAAEWINNHKNKNVKKRAAALISIGTNPTFGDEKLSVEVNIVGLKSSSLNLYGKQLKIAFHARIRPIRKYDEPQSLIRQLFYESKIAAAAWALESGRVIVIPTDTVIGLACSYYIPQAANSIYSLKERSTSKPLQILVSTTEQAYTIGYFNDDAKRFAKNNWPGPFTVIVPKKDEPGKTVGLRVSDNRLVSDLIKFVGPLYCSSANKAGEQTPTSVNDVIKLFDRKVEAFFFKNKISTGIPSAVIDFTGPTPQRLR